MTIHALRIELGDTSVEFPIMSDDEYSYFLGKHDWSIQRASMDAAKSIMLKLSMRTDETVDIFSIKGSSAAKNYMQALQMYIKNPGLNSLYDKVQGYAGGISKADMLANDSNLDNNSIVQPEAEIFTYRPSAFRI
tara:strand:- start:215 stop:619 length:405 start_codon:yes stop_codon:yes gene_type:complete